MATARTIIESFGGSTALAELLGEGINRGAVAEWKKSGIPARHWLKLMRLPSVEIDGQPLTLDMLEAHTWGPNGQSAECEGAGT